MTTHSSATPHANRISRTNTIMNALKQRAQAVLNDKEKVDLPDFEEGYGIWRRARDAGEAGAYSITVAEAVEIMETALNR